MVWDSAAKSNGMSLNAVLLKGPDQLTSLPEILYSFRFKPIAISGDIRQMFHQVLIKKVDQDLQRFLWRSNNGQLDEYVMQVGQRVPQVQPTLLKTKMLCDFQKSIQEPLMAL